MKPNYLLRVVSLLVLASAALTAQVARQGNVVPLKNWATPLYWQPNQVEREATGNAVPQLQFSANQVSAGALTFVAITPCRLVDTRGATAGFNGISPFSGPSIPAAGTITIPVQSPTEATTDTTPAPCGVIPSIAQAYSFNLTVVPAVLGTAVDYVTMWPAGGTQPVVSTLDDPQGAIASNAAIVPAGPSASPGYGGVSVYNYGPATANVIVDMNGYYAAPTDLNSNTAIGFGAMQSSTTGSANTAVGNYALAENTTGCCNTASGQAALLNNTTGTNNTASGYQALFSNTTASGNTADGTQALQLNTTGYNNTAVGNAALQNNTTGYNNMASGLNALNANTIGYDNTAVGQNALSANSTAAGNTAVGQNALGANTTAGGNTAVGSGALSANTTGNNNAASGAGAMAANTTGFGNTASGWFSLIFNTTGGQNTAVGNSALFSNTTGNANIGIGINAGRSAPDGNSSSIYIGTEGSAGDNSGTITIGTVGTQTSAHIAGIYGGTPSTPNLLVCVDANGTLGTTGCSSTPSSRRFKEQISDMGDSSSKLFQLRPVTFLYKPEYDDGSHALQYGLIAEEVAKVYPDMVGYDKDGQPASVKYQSLAPMLLNEVQKQNAQLQNQNVRLQNQVQVQQEENRKLEDRLAALEALLSGHASTVARPAGSQ